MKNAKLRTAISLLFTIIFFGSCVGVSVDIALNQNGSGTATLEYRISRQLESLGELDGNERWNTIPAGRADFERTLDRLPGMKLLSFSEKEDEKDLVIAAKMEFENPQALLAFLDAGGRRSNFSGSGQSGSITFTLSEGAEIKNPDLYELIKEISAPYSVTAAMSFPGEGSLALTDSRGEALTAPEGSEIESGGKKVSFTIPLYEVLSSAAGITAEFAW